jgi:hypothetical protein
MYTFIYFSVFMMIWLGVWKLLAKYFPKESNKSIENGKLFVQIFTFAVIVITGIFSFWLLPIPTLLFILLFKK